MEEGIVSMKAEYRSYIAKKVLFIMASTIAIFLSMGFAVSAGKFDIGFIESYEILLHHLMGDVQADPMRDYIVWELRLPRAIMGAFVGAGLSAGGAAMQSMMKNPLADPYTTGVASGASLGAATSIIMGICVIPSLSGHSATVINSFVFSIIPTSMIVLISKYRRTTPTMIILSGIAVMYIFSATTSMMMLIADPEDLAEVYIWNVGTLGKATWENVPVVAAIVSVGVLLLGVAARDLNVLTAGDRSAVGLGVNVNIVRLICLVTISMVTAAVVSFTGTIGFVGLIAPHIVRMFLGSDNRYLIPASVAFGAAFLISVDCLAKEAGPTGLPVGVITALVGGPLFLFLLLKVRRNSRK
jgi:iron complex transport system permease protein